jgi:hypothetical protein
MALGWSGLDCDLDLRASGDWIRFIRFGWEPL